MTINFSEINFSELNFPMVLDSPATMFQWCCECGARHVWTFEVVRGDVEEDDSVYINCVRDWNAEKLRKFYEKYRGKTRGKTRSIK